MPFVLFISYSGALGGAERVLVEFATALEGGCCLGCPEGPLARSARAAGVRVFPLREHKLNLRATPGERLRAAQRLAAHALQARALVRDLAPDLVVACGMRSAIAVLLLGRRPRAPVVFQHNDMLPGPLVGRIVRAAAARADRVIVPSHAVAEDLGARIPAVVVHPGIDVGQFADNGAPADPPEVLVLGALVPWKRPDIALEACAVARRSRPDLRLRVLGAALAGDSDGFEAQLRERASRPDLAGAVEFAGPVADPRPDLGRASCLLHCAPREPFGLAVLEALAAGRPAVVPRSAGPAEIVDESCAILYPPGDAGAAAQAVLAVLASPESAARMGASGRARAQERFDRSAARRRFAAAVTRLTASDTASGTAPGRAGSPPDLALLTVSHNSAGELSALLESVERHLSGTRVIVVDSGSSDGSVEVASKSPSAVSVPLAENVGFGRACNRGLAEIREPITALVNPDVELLDDSLLALAAEALRTDRAERLLAPLVLSADGSRQDSVHPMPGSGAETVVALIPPALLPGRAAVGIAPWRSRRPRRVGWAVGCAVVAKTVTLQRLGPFDERIFLYGEDLDLGLRAARDGIETWFWPAARVLHHRAHSTTEAFGGEPFERLARARHDVVQRRLGANHARRDDRIQALTFASRIGLKRALGRDAGRERRQLEALARARRIPG